MIDKITSDRIIERSKQGNNIEKCHTPASNERFGWRPAIVTDSRIEGIGNGVDREEAGWTT